jgi:hypothetical protein
MTHEHPPDDQEQSIDDRLDSLESEVEQLRERQTQVDALAEQRASGQLGRRTFLTALAAAGVGGGLIGAASAHSASPSWGSATGVLGEESKPFDRGFVRDLHSDQLHADSEIVDASGTSHSGELADDGDAQPPEAHGSSDHDNSVPVDGTNSGYEIQKNGSDTSGVINFKT